MDCNISYRNRGAEGPSSAMGYHDRRRHAFAKVRNVAALGSKARAP